MKQIGPTQAGDLIVYQEGTIVSKELVRNSGGTVTLFAFDAGQELSEHTAPFDALVQIIDGMCQIFVDKTPYSLVAGDVLLMPANHPHKVVALGKLKMLLTMIRS